MHSADASSTANAETISQRTTPREARQGNQKEATAPGRGETLRLRQRPPLGTVRLAKNRKPPAQGGKLPQKKAKNSGDWRSRSKHGRKKGQVRAGPIRKRKNAESPARQIGTGQPRFCRRAMGSAKKDCQKRKTPRKGVGRAGCHGLPKPSLASTQKIPFRTLKGAKKIETATERGAAASKISLAQ